MGIARMTKDTRKAAAKRSNWSGLKALSDAQLYALDLAAQYKLQRSSMGWWAVDHRGMAPGSSSPQIQRRPFRSRPSSARVPLL